MNTPSTTEVLPSDEGKLKEFITRRYGMMLDGEICGSSKDFYRYLNRMLNGQASCHSINIPSEEDCLSAVEIMSDHSDKLEHLVGKVEYGDLVENVAISGYRTDGVYVVASQKDEPLKLMNLQDDPDDYGTIPSEFQVITDFPIHYWGHITDNPSSSTLFQNAYWHNDYVWFDPTKVDTPPSKSIRHSKDEIYYPFTHKGIKYAIVASKNVNLKGLSYYYCSNSFGNASDRFVEYLHNIGYSDAQLLFTTEE